MNGTTSSTFGTILEWNLCLLILVSISDNAIDGRLTVSSSSNQSFQLLPPELWQTRRELWLSHSKFPLQGHLSRGLLRGFHIGQVDWCTSNTWDAWYNLSTFLKIVGSMPLELSIIFSQQELLLQSWGTELAIQSSFEGELLHHLHWGIYFYYLVYGYYILTEHLRVSVEFDYEGQGPKESYALLLVPKKTVCKLPSFRGSL